MNKSSIRVLVVDDYEPWRHYYSATLKEWGLQILEEASNGLEAVQKAQELQPDVILLDIGLPKLNGIEAARRIQGISRFSKILFVSENHSADIAKEALSTGASGYVIKSSAATDLLPAIEAVLAGKRFVSAGLFSHDSDIPMDDRNTRITHSHEVAFYPDEASLVDGYARFIESAFRDGNVVIAVLTESHQTSLPPKLAASGVDLPAAIEQGRYVQLEANVILSRLTVHDMPDPVRCTKEIRDLIMLAANNVKGEYSRVVVCGEIAPTLLSRGNDEGAVKLEHLWDEITRSYGVRTLCGYLSNAFPYHEADPVFQRICTEHTAVHGRSCVTT